MNCADDLLDFRPIEGGRLPLISGSSHSMTPLRYRPRNRDTTPRGEDQGNRFVERLGGHIERMPWFEWEHCRAVVRARGASEPRLFPSRLRGAPRHPRAGV